MGYHIVGFLMGVLTPTLTTPTPRIYYQVLQVARMIPF